jgi:hypothetical protein
MKMKIALTVFAASVFLFACKEKGPAINSGTSGTAAKDTTYISSKMEAADPKIVLVEEFTGASCAPCPPARDLLANYISQHPNRVLPLELHVFPFPQAAPTSHSKYDFRTQVGTDIKDKYYPDIQGIPAAGIDRMSFNNEKALTPSSKWANAIDERLAKETPVNIKIESSYDASAKTATIKVKVSYTKLVSQKQFLSVAVLEKDIEDVQKYDFYIDDHYIFKHTFRDLLTAVSGDEFLKDMPAKEPGRVYERTFIYPVNEAWNPEKCDIIVFVHNNDAGNAEVLQAAETELKGQ